jgi:DHA2 family lincomycin resistance protein-like MFS transporter
MGVATRVLIRELAITVQAAQWLTPGFVLTMAVVIPVTGYLLPRFPVRPVYLTAMVCSSLERS